MRHRRAGRRTSRAVLSALVLLIVPLLGAAPAQAHGVLISTSPKYGATVSTTPTEVVLTFDQPALAVGTQLRVSGPGGEVQQGLPRLVDTTVRQPLAPGSPAGRYTVEWRVTSADGHPISGSFAFTSEAAGLSGAEGAAGTPSATADTAIPATTSPAITSSGQGATTRPGSTSDTTGGSDGTGTSWAVWLVVAVLALAGAGVTAVRLRRGHAGRGRG